MVRARVLSVLVALAALVMAPPLVAGPAAATYPGQDGRIAFVRANQIHTMNAQGGAVRRLTSAGRNFEPAWSPDGRRIAYLHAEGGRRDVWVMNATGGAKRAVTTSGDVQSAGVAWSPDGRSLAFGGPARVGDVVEDRVLQVVSATRRGARPTVVSGYATGGWCGSGPEEPVDSFVVDQYLAWAPAVPGGSRLAIKTTDCYFDYAIGMYHPATGEVSQEMAGGGDCCGYAEWRDLFFGPTGQLGLTVRDLGEYGEEPGPRLIVYPGFVSVDGDTGGAPSPSGRFMALTNDASGTAHVLRADIDGTDRRRLAVGYQPDWGRRP